MDCPNDQTEPATISAVHPDIIEAHILARLDGPTLASAGCASSHLHALCSQQKLWRDICASAWPSVGDPRVHRLISSFPSGYRSLYSDSFPLLDHSSRRCSNRGRLSSTHELISAVDIFYKDSLIFSKVQETETVSGWFLCSPFRVDLLDPKESVPTPIRHVAGEEDEDEAWLRHLEENLRLSWIVIDPTRKRAANVSSRKAVSVQRHWLTGEVQLRYATIMAAEGGGDHVECAVVVTCGGNKEGMSMKQLQVREVSLQVEDMEGKHLSGRESLGILESAIEGGERKNAKGNEGKDKYEEYLEMKIERKEKKVRMERALDLTCIVTGISMFLGFWTFLVFR